MQAPNSRYLSNPDQPVREEKSPKEDMGGTDSGTETGWDMCEDIEGGETPPESLPGFSDQFTRRVVEIFAEL
jgi:hypothetical protein